MTTPKENELLMKYKQEQGQKPAILNVTDYECKNNYGNQVNLDYYKVLTIDYYLFLLEQIK